MTEDLKTIYQSIFQLAEIAYYSAGVRDPDAFWQTLAAYLGVWALPLTPQQLVFLHLVSDTAWRRVVGTAGNN